MHRDTETRQEIERLIGAAGLKLLIEQLGGTKIFVPKRIGRHHPLAAAIGQRRADIIAAHFAGNWLTLPKAHFRRKQALEMIKEGGMLQREIALATDYSQRQIERLAARHRGRADSEDDQPSLF